MSKAKTPRQKKELSLTRDRRSAGTDTAKTKPKHVAQAKQRSHQQERHAVDQVLHAISPTPDEDELIEIENAAKVTAKLQHERGFKKTPDVPLKKVLEAKSERKNGAQNE